MPEKVRDICSNKRAEITQLEELVKSLEYDFGTLRGKYVELLKKSKKECGRMVSAYCDCGTR